MLSMLFLLAVSDPQAELPRQWAQFSRRPARRYVNETVDIATADRAADGAFRFTLRLTRESPVAETEILWADSATCPAVQSVIATMRDIEMPRPAPYGVTDEQVRIVMDGTTYTLTAPSSDSAGRFMIQSNVGSPLATWVEDAFNRLESCWTKRA